MNKKRFKHTKESKEKMSESQKKIKRNRNGRGRFIEKEIDLETIKRLYGSGKSTLEIGKLMNVSGDCILNKLKKINFPIKKMGDYPTWWERKGVVNPMKIKKISKKVSIKLKNKHNSLKTEFKAGSHLPEEMKNKLSKIHKKRVIDGKCHLWGGGITPINLLIRQQSKYKIWRELVFLRDNFTCQNPNCEYCNNKVGGIILNAHHIKPFATYPELRFDLNNGITYCAEYHLNSKELHKNICKEVKIQ